MANDFSGDSRCKALWRFESLGALTVDSISTNTLALHNTPTCDVINQLEGAGAMLCSVPNNSGADIADASLSAGFPLKSGDSVKKITICGWFRPTSLQTSAPFGKFANAAGDSFLFVQNTSSWSLGWVHAGSASWWQFIGSISSGVAYHISLIIDGVAGTAKLRIWDGSTATNYTNNFGSTLDVGSSPFLISYCSWGLAPFGGDVDEVVVFNDLLSDAEIDAIRNGTFSAVATRNLTTACAAVSTIPAPLVTATRPLTTSVAVVSAIPDFSLWKNSTTPFPYSPPNTPANDPTCVARWRFETGDGIQDFIGGNDLTGLPGDNPPGTTPTCKEGISAQAFVAANSQYLTRADADLSADFPLKSTADQIGNISGWIYANYDGNFNIRLFAKGDTSDGLLIAITQGYLDIYWMGQRYLGLANITTGRWYHLSINVDGPNKTLGVRFWDDTAQSVVLGQHSFTNALTGNSSAFTVGGPGSFWDGAIDELIVWNRKLTIAEMELVQEQYFHGDVQVENNNFISDPYCQAVWDFEESAPTDDSSGKGNNLVTDTLIPSFGLVGAGDSGKYCGDFIIVPQASIPDTNLTAHFPFKSSDINKKVTVCMWIVNTIDIYFGNTIFAKHGTDTDHNGFAIIKGGISSPYTLQIVWGDGSSLTTFDTGIPLVFNCAYHISVEIDGINKVLYVEVFNNHTGVVTTFSVNPSTQATVSSAPLSIGAFGGYIDQVVVWNRLLSPAELATVRAGTFISHLVATDIAVQSQTPSINLIVQRTNLATSVAVVSNAGTPALKVDRPLATLVGIDRRAHV